MSPAKHRENLPLMRFIKKLFGFDAADSSALTVTDEVAADGMQPTQRELDSVAMDVVLKRCCRIDHYDAKWGHVTKLDIDQAQAGVDRLRAWVQTQPDRRVRSAYEGWLRFLEHEYGEARKELETHADRDRTERYWKERDAHWARVAKIDLPKPP